MPPIRWSRLGKEIAAVLLIKTLVLSLLWNLFFSRPLDDHLSNEKIGDYLFEPSSPESSGSTPTGLDRALFVPAAPSPANHSRIRL